MPKVLRSPAAISEEDAMQQVMQAINGKPAAASRNGTSVIVEVELAPMPPSEFGVHLDMRLTPPQSTTARRIAAHLDRQQACLRNGQRVLTPSGAIKWLLEQIEKDLPTS